MRLVVARSLLGAAWLVGAAGAAAEPLADVLGKVYLTSPRLEAGRAGLRAADEAVPRALAAGRPQLSSTSSAALNAAGDALPTARQALNLSQSLYSGGATRAATDRAENAVRAERARLMQLEQEVLLDAVTAYTAVARDAAVLELARRNEERLRLQLDATRDRERFGDVTRTDIFQAESRHARAVAERVAAEGALNIAAAEYRRVVGEDPAQPTLPPVLEDAPVPLEVALAEAQGSWRWQAASFELAAARDEVAVSLAGLKPRLTLGGEVSYAEDPGGYRDSGANAAIGATLAVPLYQGGGEHARVRQSKQIFTQRRHGRDDTLRAVEAEITAAWEAARTAEAAIRSIRAQVDAAAFALDGVRQEALVGARTVLDVLDAEQELFAAEVELARAERERVLADYRQRAAVGRLTARDLSLAVAYHLPDEHYRDTRGRWFGLGPRLGAE